MDLLGRKIDERKMILMVSAFALSGCFGEDLLQETSEDLGLKPVVQEDASRTLIQLPSETLQALNLHLETEPGIPDQTNSPTLFSETWVFPNRIIDQGEEASFAWSCESLECQSITFTHRIIRRSGEEVRSGKSILIQPASRNKRGSIPLKELFSGLEGYLGELAQVDDQHETELSIALADGTQAQAFVQFRIRSALEPIASTRRPEAKPESAAHFVQTLSTQGWEVRKEHFQNHKKQPVHLWIKADPKASQLTSEVYIETSSYQERPGAKPQGPLKEVRISSQKWVLSKIQVAREESDEKQEFVVSEGNPWIDIPVNPGEEIEVSWLIEPQIMMNVCAFLPKMNTKKSWVEETVDPGIARLLYLMQKEHPVNLPKTKTFHEEEFEVGESIVGAKLSGSFKTEILLTHPHEDPNQFQSLVRSGMAQRLEKGSSEFNLVTGGVYSNLSPYPCQGIFPKSRPIF